LLFALDVTKQESVDGAYDRILKEFGSVDVLVNNAGYALNGPFEFSTDEQIRREFDVNVFGLFNVTRTFLKHFREKRAGVVINISSMGGKITFPLISTYHSTKFAVEGFTESLSYELSALGIKAKLVEPGNIATDFGGRSLDIAKSETIRDYDEFMKSFRSSMSKSGMKYSQPEMVAEVIYEAATDNSNKLRYIAGEDAKQYIEIREGQGDEAFVKSTRERI